MPLAASEIWLLTAAVSRPPSTSVFSDGHLLQRGAAARALVGGDLLAGEVDVRHDLALEAALVDRGERPLVAGERELLHVFAGDVPLLGDHLGAAELRDLLVAVALAPADASPENGSVKPNCCGDRHRARDRDHAHVLHAAGDDQIAGAAT